jgi:hypothetical protein
MGYPQSVVDMAAMFTYNETVIYCLSTKQGKVMKAQIGDYIKTEKGPRLIIKADPDNGYELEDGQALADSDITYDDELIANYKREFSERMAEAKERKYWASRDVETV